MRNYPFAILAAILLMLMAFFAEYTSIRYIPRSALKNYTHNSIVSNYYTLNSILIERGLAKPGTNGGIVLLTNKSPDWLFHWELSTNALWFIVPTLTNSVAYSRVGVLASNSWCVYYQMSPKTNWCFIYEDEQCNELGRMNRDEEFNTNNLSAVVKERLISSLRNVEMSEFFQSNHIKQPKRNVI